MSATSNFDEIEALLDNLATISFQDDHGGKTLGDACLDIVAERILDRTLAGQADPDGRALAFNSDNPKGKGYASRKRRKGVFKVGVGLGSVSGRGSSARGEMLSDIQVRGRRTIGPMEAVMLFGQDDRVNRKGQWFTAGSVATGGLEPSGARNQPARRFYERDAESDSKVADECFRHYSDMVDRLVGNGV